MIGSVSMKVNYIMLLQLVGIIVPLIGIFTLFKKEQNKTSMNLMVANVGFLIINGCYLLILQSSRYDEAMLALKMEHLGSVLFY